MMWYFLIDCDFQGCVDEIQLPYGGTLAALGGQAIPPELPPGWLIMQAVSMEKRGFVSYCPVHAPTFQPVEG